LGRGKPRGDAEKEGCLPVGQKGENQVRGEGRYSESSHPEKEASGGTGGGKGREEVLMQDR